MPQGAVVDFELLVKIEKRRYLFEIKGSLSTCYEKLIKCGFTSSLLPLFMIDVTEGDI